MTRKKRLQTRESSVGKEAALGTQALVPHFLCVPLPKVLGRQPQGETLQLEAASAHLRSPEGVGPAPSSPPLRRRSAPVCLHLVYSCVQSYLGAHSTPRAGLCTFITTQPFVDSPTYRSHLHHLTRPRGACGLLPDLTSGGWAAMGTALSQPKARSSPPTASACLPPRDLGGRTFLVKPCGEASYKHATG